MTVVLDTCAAFEIIFHGDNYNKYAEMLSKADKVIAPSMLDAEVTNVMWKYARAGYVDIENAKLSLALGIQLVDEFVPTAELAVESLHEALRLNHPVYDLYFLVLARRNGATLLTVDEKLKRLALECGVTVL